MKSAEQTEIHIRRRKLIEVALPLDVINKASVRESFIYRGNPSAIHKWWAQRPLAAARAVIFCQMVDDPSSCPDIFSTEEAQQQERQRLCNLIEELVQWENTTNEAVLQRARDEIWRSWRRTCDENADHRCASDWFNDRVLPAFHDPFAGGATLPLEAQRLGLESYASDLNPVAVLINKATIEIPSRFSGRVPVNPGEKGAKDLIGRTWEGSRGLSDDIRYYGRWICEEAQRRIGHLYPTLKITAEAAKGRPDIKQLVGRDLVVIGWLWARSIRSPNPAFSDVEVPLVSTFMLSTRAGREVYVEPVIDGHGYHFSLRVGKPKNVDAIKMGTKLSRGANFKCLMSGMPIEPDYIRNEAKAGRMHARLLAVVAESELGRVYLAPTPAMEDVAGQANPVWKPDVEFFQQALGFRVGNYGMSKWSDLFTDRQLVALTTLSDLITEARDRIELDAISAGFSAEATRLNDGGDGASAYADAVTAYLAFVLSKVTDYNCTLVPWYTKEDRPGHLFSKQAIPMVWDFAELNPLSSIGGGFEASTGIVADALTGCAGNRPSGHANQLDAVSLRVDERRIFSTDPPYYDNIGYADLSDFFYVWLRRTLKPLFPDLFATLSVPKAEELVATTERHGGKAKAEAFFLDGMTQAMRRLAEQAHPAFPVTIYYAFKQSETDGESGTTSTGWEIFLDAVIRAGFSISGTWPMRTERTARSRGIASNALASSIVLVCRPRANVAGAATRREFVNALKADLLQALAHLQRGNIAPVDLVQAAIGPGMAVYTRYSRVLDAEGKSLSVHEALSLINQTLDEALAEQEGEFDAETRWALTWFEQSGFAEGGYGLAEQLSKSKNTSVAGMVEARILESKRGKVRLFKPAELRKKWDPATETRLTAWEVVHQLVRALESGGEAAAASFVAGLGGRAEAARELAYRLYTTCERKKRPAEALSYNALVQSWPEINRLAREGAKPDKRQSSLFAGVEE